MERALLDQLLKAKSTRKPVAVVTWLSSGTQQLIDPRDALVTLSR